MAIAPVPASLPIVPSDHPLPAVVLDTDMEAPDECSRSVLMTLSQLPFSEWWDAIFSSAPFPTPWPDCRCNRCIDTDFLIHVDKNIPLTGLHGRGVVKGVHHFADGWAVMEVVGPDVVAENSIVYIEVPRKFVSFNLIDEIRFRISWAWYQIKVFCFSPYVHQPPHRLDRQRAQWFFL